MDSTSDPTPKTKPTPTDYVVREYGVTVGEVEAFERAAEQRYRKLKRRGKLATKTPQDLKKMIEEAAGH
ncbi:MAG: hypothetical protein C5B50_12085 [Verrucomicrobia bacterium]|nr:MAG: hypothetical protein C5B50_12085 [Verrucomicrobiota bacterium]